MNAGLAGALGVSPLHAYWSARMTTNAWDRAGDLTLTDEISSAEDEAAAFGAGAAFGDISHRAVTSISGPEAGAFLAALSGEPREAFAAGRTRSIVWCDADGFARGAGRVAMRGPDAAVLVSEVSDRQWLNAAASPFDVRLERAAAVGVRLAGPLTPEVLRNCSAAPGPACDLAFPGLGPVLAAPAKGEAVDLWTEPENALALVWTLERAGARPAGTRALNAWRIAHGVLSAGADWRPAQHCVSRAAMRTRAQLTGGDFAVAAWNAPPPAEVSRAVYWPALGQFMAVLWLPPQSGRGQMAPGGAMILGPAATD